MIGDRMGEGRYSASDVGGSLGRVKVSYKVLEP